MRNVVKKGFTAEFRNRNKTHNSLKVKNQFWVPQLGQLISIMTATKYGRRERIRNSKIKNEVVANFLSICAIFTRRMSWSVALWGMVVFIVKIFFFSSRVGFQCSRCVCVRFFLFLHWRLLRVPSRSSTIYTTSSVYQLRAPANFINCYVLSSFNFLFSLTFASGCSRYGCLTRNIL